MNFEKLKSDIKDFFKTAPGCHDWQHTLRVLKNAQRIAKLESLDKKINLDIITAAALLHDVGRPEELKQNGAICHAQLGAKIAKKFLINCGCKDQSFIKAISECIKRHRYRNNLIPETIEEKIIFDADKLDSIGAVGVARAIHFSGRIGSVLHNTKEEALNSTEYSSEDSAYREYLVKLQYIPKKMLTKSGRKLAEERAEFMHLFFDKLNQES